MAESILPPVDPEGGRLIDDLIRQANWKRWGPYLADRQWGTVREDYSATGEVWTYLPHDHARSRAYRWGEDGLLGICDREGRLCFALALWNQRDPILKERLFGLTGPEGNHGEDVKECYYHLDATPTASWLRALYRYPQAAFPYAQLVEENARRGRQDREYELVDTGVFDGDRYCDVVVSYAKRGPDDLLIRIDAHNRGPDPAPLHILPTLWCRNSWSWGRTGEGYWPRPAIGANGTGGVVADHASLGRFVFVEVTDTAGGAPLLITENDTNVERLFDVPNSTPFVKDSFHRLIVEGEQGAVKPAGMGTKVAFHHSLSIGPGESHTLRYRLVNEKDVGGAITVAEFDAAMTEREQEADRFYAARISRALDPDSQRTVRHAYAGLIWTKQFFHCGVREWLEGDPAQPAPPASRRAGRNHEWTHLYSRDVLSMPDGWEYPWFAAWDLAFHCVAFARIDPHYAKEQLILMCREWYMHPNGQVPAYEFAFGDVNPPVHAWACWRVYKATGPRGQRDRAFLERTFQKLLINFTWWVNRKDPLGENIFSGGFLGLDNVGVFDRSLPLPGGGILAQADGTAWMAFYCTTMLAIALELARDNPVYEDVASKFFEHFVAICDAMNRLGDSGLWNEQDGFYYDQLMINGKTIPLALRSIVGVIPLFAAEILDDHAIAALPGFTKRMQWFLTNRTDLAQNITYMEHGEGSARRLLAVPTRDRLIRVLRCVLDETELLSPYGVRSLSRAYRDTPYSVELGGEHFSVQYTSGESDTGLFGGNSNWRGPVWFPLNYLLIEALERYHHFYGDSLTVEFPTGSGVHLNLEQVAGELSARLASLFVPDAGGLRPWQGGDSRFREPGWRDLPLFHEYFDGDSGRGCGASHQTGWTALVARLFDAVPVRHPRHPESPAG